MAIAFRASRLSSPGQIKPRGTPRIDWSHPLTTGLLFYAYDVGGTAIDLVRGFNPTWVGTPDGQALSAYGTGVSWANSSQYFASDASVQSATAAGNFSWACAYVQTGTVGQFTRPFGRTAQNGGAAPFANWDFEINFFGQGQNQVEANYSNSGATGNVTIGPWTGNANNVFTSLAASVTSAGAGTLYAQGSSVATSSSIPGSSNTNDGVFFSGASSAAVSNNFIGSVFYGAFWSRVLGADEVMLLHQDPYCFLTYDEGEWPALFLSVVGGPPAFYASPFLAAPGSLMSR